MASSGATRIEPTSASSRVGAALTVAGAGLLAVAIAWPHAAAAPLLGGLGLNALIIGPFFAARPLFRRIRDRLPPWLPW
jgi:hypothetical protein